MTAVNIDKFLDVVITTDEGWFCLALRDAESNWIEEWYRWPSDRYKIVERALGAKDTHDLYFSSYLFSERNSSKKFVLPSRTIQADLDEANLDTVVIKPTVIVKSSQGRHQAYWILKTLLTTDIHEHLSRKITYSIPKCDHSGWPLGHKMRLPDTLNHKYLTGPQEVSVAESSLVTHDPSNVELIQADIKTADKDDEWITGPKKELEVGPRTFLESIKSLLPPRVITEYSIQTSDRSKSLWSLMCALFRAGVDRDSVFQVSRVSANNKFKDLKYHADRELAKDVLRAEQVVLSRETDVRLAIVEARRLNAMVSERRNYIATLVTDDMKSKGNFAKAQDDSLWYIPRDAGRPIAISRFSEYLDTVLDIQYGLNRTETEQSYTSARLCAYCRTLPISINTASLSFYDEYSNTCLIHTGRNDVAKITPNGIEVVNNGTFGVLFPWTLSNEPFSVSQQEYIDWTEIMFGDLTNIINLSAEEARAILKSWFMFLLLRTNAVSRPILALFGQPGAGKSTIFRRLYRVIYGRDRSLGTITTPDDFDFALTTDPLVVLDNVDTWERWLPDRLAQSASTSDIIKRKLYTDVDQVILKRQALVAITAHNPKFGREDVADRLLLLTFERLPSFIPETELLSSIGDNRARIWWSIITDIQKVLQTPIPSHIEIPQFRVEDFSRLGIRVSKALGCEDTFRKALQKVSKSQKSFSLEEENILVTSIQELVSTQKTVEYRSPAQLWDMLETCATDPLSFKRIYRSPVSLGKKLWSMHNNLKSMFSIEWKLDPASGARYWRIDEREQE